VKLGKIMNSNLLELLQN